MRWTPCGRDGWWSVVGLPPDAVGEDRARQLGVVAGDDGANVRCGA